MMIVKLLNCLIIATLVFTTKVHRTQSTQSFFDEYSLIFYNRLVH